MRAASRRRPRCCGFSSRPRPDGSRGPRAHGPAPGVPVDEGHEQQLRVSPALPPASLSPDATAGHTLSAVASLADQRAAGWGQVIVLRGVKVTVPAADAGSLRRPSPLPGTPRSPGTLTSQKGTGTEGSGGTNGHTPSQTKKWAMSIFLHMMVLKILPCIWKMHSTYKFLL